MTECCGLWMMRIWRSKISGSPNLPPISRGSCHNALLSSKISRGKYSGASTSYIPRSCGSRQSIIVSFLNLSRKRRIVPILVQKDTKKRKKKECILAQIHMVYKVFMVILSAMWAPMSGGKFFWTDEMTQIASDLAPSSRLLHRIFLISENKQKWVIFKGNDNKMP